MVETVNLETSWWVVASHGGGVDVRLLYPTKEECEKYIAGRGDLYAAELVSAVRLELAEAGMDAEARRGNEAVARLRRLETALRDAKAAHHTDFVTKIHAVWAMLEGA